MLLDGRHILQRNGNNESSSPYKSPILSDLPKKQYPYTTWLPLYRLSIFCILLIIIFIFLRLFLQKGKITGKKHDFAP